MAWITTSKKTGNKHLQYRIKRPDGSWAIKSIKLGKITAAEAKLILQRFETDRNCLKLGLSLPSANITLKELCDEYVHSLPGLKSEYTIDRETRRLRYFCEIGRQVEEAAIFFKHQLNPKAKTLGDLMISQILPDALEKFIYLKKYKPNYARLLIVNLRAVYKYAVDRNYLNSNTMLNVRIPKLEKLPPRYVDPDVIDTVLKAMKGPIRDYFLILKYTGMRPSEALRLQVQDVSKHGIVIRHTKTKRFRAVPVHQELDLVLKRLCKGKSKNDYLFPSITGDGHQKSMKKGLELAIKRSGIKEPISAYSFRHTFATEVLRKTANLRAVQTLLGHSHTTMTERYAHALPETLKDAVESLK